MENQPFNHTEWTVERIGERLRHLSQYMVSMPHSPERMAQLKHEHDCLDFELKQQIHEELNDGTATPES